MKLKVLEKKDEHGFFSINTYYHLLLLICRIYDTSPIHTYLHNRNAKLTKCLHFILSNHVTSPGLMAWAVKL